MKILFVMSTPGWVSHYQTAMRGLLEAGHTVTFAYQSDRNKDGIEQVFGQRLREEFPESVSIQRAPDREPGLWTDLAWANRRTQDYARYFLPEFKHATALRARIEVQVPRAMRALVRTTARIGLQPVLAAALAAVERGIPRSDAIEDFIIRAQPDVLLVTPLVDPGSAQVDYVRSAQALGIPTGFCVASWDNLTNKGAMRVVPDRVFVWNAAQRKEAVSLHGVPESRVVITGAQLFDKWFSWRSDRTRAEFCARVGLDPARPYVLYLGSSSFIAPNEAVFVERWIRAVRAAADPLLSLAGILIRPHPNNSRQYLGVDYSAFPNVALWPAPGADRLAPAYQADYFDSMYHSSAVVGVNTSGMIESGILGKPVFTVLSRDFEHSQAGTLHFQHIADPETGLLHLAKNLDEHVAQLARAVATPEARDERSEKFVRAFVRPLGLDVNAARVLSCAIADLGALRAAASEPLRSTRIRRALLLPLAVIATVAWPFEPRPWWVVFIRVPLTIAVALLTARLMLRERRREWSSQARRSLRSTRKRLRGRWQEASKTTRRAVRLGVDRTTRGARRAVKRGRKDLRELAKRARRMAQRAHRHVLGAVRGSSST
ncbi:MAG: hypothetical protein AB1635_00965 [Acidobacteriota bacterium]